MKRLKVLRPVPLRWLLPLGLAASIAGVAIGEALFVRLDLRRHVASLLQESVRRDLALAAQSFNEHAVRGDLDRIRQEVVLTTTARERVGAFLVGPQGTVVAATRLDAVGQPPGVAWARLGLAEPASSRGLLAAPPPMEPHVEVSGEVVWGVAAVPLPASAAEPRTRVRGAYVLVAGIDPVLAVARRRADQRLAVVLGVAALLALAAAVVARRAVVRRVDRLVAATRRLREGDFTARARLRGSDEIGELGEAFDQLAEHLEQDRRKLTESEQRLRQIFEATSDGIVLLDAEGRITHANPRAAEIFGRSSTELPGTGLPELFVTGAPPLPAGEAPALAQGSVRREPGTEVEVELSSRRLPDGRVVTIVRDLSERKAMHAKMMQADRLASLGTLAAGVGHEMNNPLTYVMGNLSLALKMVDGSDSRSAELRALLADASEGASRLATVVQGLRALARPDESREGAVDLHRVVRIAEKMTALEVKHRGELVVELGPCPRVRGNESRLGQVLVNLIVNAAQALDESHGRDKRITVSVGTAPDGSALVRVADTGVGIPPELVGRIFEPFVTTKPVGVGTGLGLWVCHRIVTALGGRIEVESEVGRGTTFTLTLPAASEPEVTAPSPPPETPLRAFSVLVIDDEPAVARVLGRWLESVARVDVVTSGEAGLERLLDGGRVDAVVCDLHMPGLDGAGLVERLEHERPELLDRLLFVTGGVLSARARSVVERFADRVLDKPVSPETLRAKVQAIAEGRHPRATQGP